MARQIFFFGGPLLKKFDHHWYRSWVGAENLATIWIRFPDRPARSESLYRLSYPGPIKKVK